MNDQQNIEQDDVEAHRVHPVTEIDDDVEGHRVHNKVHPLSEDDDVEGHRVHNKVHPLSEDDDVEGHSQPPRDIDTRPIS